MKNCQVCGANYDDDTLQFCLQDGTRLTGMPITDTPTVVLNEAETVVARANYGRINVPIGQDTSQFAQAPLPAAVPPRSGGATILIGVAAVLVIGVLVLVAAGVGGYLWYSNSESANVRPATNVNNNSNSNLSLPVTNSNATNVRPSPSKTPTPVVNANIPADPLQNDDVQTRADVTRQVNSWRAVTESQNLNGLGGYYAGTLDRYYNRSNVSAGDVLADKRRAFSQYSSIQISVSNMRVTADPGGETATAVFDKEWYFNGSKPFAGKIKSQMRFRRVNGAWLITSETDVPGTYVRIR